MAVLNTFGAWGTNLMMTSEDIINSVRIAQTRYSRWDTVDNDGKPGYYIERFCKACYKNLKDCDCTHDMLWAHMRKNDGDK